MPAQIDTGLVGADGRPLKRDLTFSPNYGNLFKDWGGPGSGGATAPMEQVSWYYAAIKIISEAAGILPPGLWRRDKGVRSGVKPGWREEFDHPEEMVLRSPLPGMTWIEWIERVFAVLLDGGDVFVIDGNAKFRGGDQPELYIFGRGQVQPIQDAWDAPLKGWRLTWAKGGRQDLRVEDVLHVRLMNPYHPVMGLAPKDSLRMDLDKDFYQSIFDKTFYRRAAMPSAVLMNKNLPILTPEQRTDIHKELDHFYGGPDNAGAVMLLGNEWEFKTWSLQHSQAQFIDSRKLTREIIAAAFSIPAGLLNAAENGGLSRAGEEVERKKLYEQGVFPIARRFEEAFNNWWFRRRDPTVSFGFKYRRSPVALAYAKEEADIAEKFTKIGVPLNDVIETYDLPFEPVAGGEIGLVDKNRMPIGMTEEAAEVALEPEEPASPPDDAEDDDEAEADAEAERRRAVVVADKTPDPMQPIRARLQAKMQRILYRIRVQALRDGAAARASHEQRREWARLTLPMVAVAVRVGATGKVPASVLRGGAAVDEELAAIQRRVEEVTLGDARLNEACRAEMSHLLDFLDMVLAAAGKSGAAKRYMARLEQSSRVIAERIVGNAMMAGRVAAVEVVDDGDTKAHGLAAAG